MQFVLYGKHSKEFKQSKFDIGKKSSNPKIDILFRKRYRMQFTEKTFEIVATARKTSPKKYIKDEESLLVRWIFYVKELTGNTYNGFI